MAKQFYYYQKKIYDSVHGFIRFDDVEKALIDSLPMQRLRYINQLGITYLIYPGATHSRFAHSLGVMELATKVYKRICKKVRPDVFDFIPMKGSIDYVYWKKILRLACLCHDLGHLPFSHVAEYEILEGKGHEYWTMQIIKSTFLKDIWKLVKDAPYFHKSFEERDVVHDVLKIALGEEKLQQLLPEQDFSFSAWERVLSKIITGDFFGVDRMDYLLRDAKSTGVAYGLFDYLQLIESLRLLPSESNDFELGIDENGLESCEALFLARHFMYKRVYLHPSIKAYNFHLKRAMQQLEVFKGVQKVEQFIAITDAQVITELMKVGNDKKHLAYADANRICYRAPHFKVIALPETVPDEKIQQFLKSKKIKKDDIFFEEVSVDLKKKDISFLVSRRYFATQEAKNLSSLFATFTFRPQKYVYIAPEYEQVFLQAIKEV